MGRRDLPTSVPADTSEFFKAEVAAFIRMLKMQQPAAWLLVQRLQLACRTEQPAGLDAEPDIAKGHPPRR